MRAQFVGAEAEVQSVWRMQKKKKKVLAEVAYMKTVPSTQDERIEVPLVVTKV